MSTEDIKGLENHAEFQGYIKTSSVALPIITLLENEKYSVTEISKIIDKPISTVSESLKKLTELNILNFSQNGKKRIYSIINNDVLGMIMNDAKSALKYDEIKKLIKENKNMLNNNFELMICRKLEEKYIIEPDVTYEGYFASRRLGCKLETEDGKKIGIRFPIEDMSKDEVYDTIGDLYEWIRITPDLDKLISIYIIDSTPSKQNANKYSLWKLESGFNSLFENINKVVIIMENVNQKELTSEEFIDYINTKIESIISTIK